MNKISTYFKGSYHELMEKVTWPTWMQLQQSTAIVLIATVIITTIIFAMDTAGSKSLSFIYSFLFKK